MVWIDIETTGLDPETDSLLEVAVVITRNDLQEVAQADYVLPYDGPRTLEMHEENGLYDECAQVATVAPDKGTIDSVEEWTINTLAAWVEAGTAPMCGSSVHFDRAFLKRHMPRLEAFFHYRNIDVSSVNEWAKRAFPDAYANLPQIKDKAHRALADVHESIATLRYWRANLQEN